MSLRAFTLAIMVAYPAAIYGQSGDWQQERQFAIGLRQHGRLTEALDAAGKILAKSERHEPGSAPLALALHDYGIIAADLNRFDEADRALRRAIRVAEDTPSNEPAAVRLLHLRLGEMYLDAGHFRQAKAVFQELQGVLEQTEPSSQHLAMALDHLAWLEIMEKRLDNGESLLQRSLRILEANPRPDASRMTEVLNDYASLMLARRRYSESADYAERAQAFFNAAGKPLDATIINTWTLLGAAYAFCSRTQQALPYIRHAVETGKSTFGEDSVRTGRLMLVAAAVLRRCGQNKEAKPLQRSGAQIVARADRDNPGRFTVDVNALR